MCIAGLPSAYTLTRKDLISVFIYYVYAYLRKDGTPYYIGKGKNDRAWKKHAVKLPTNPHNIVILESNLSELGAWALERRYIKWYGRKDLHTGILRNLTDGGDGPAGKTPWNKGKKLPPFSDETKQKIRKSAIGRKLSNDTKLKMSLIRKNKPKSEEHKSKLPFNKSIECPHCHKIGQMANMKRHHFDNCKLLLNAVL